MPIIPAKRRAEIRQAAEAYFDLGLPITPAQDKKPIWNQWQSKPRTRKEVVAAYSNCRLLNIALVLSRSPYMDVEHEDGEAGEQALLELFGGEIPKTPTWTSPRGVHRLFVRPENLPQVAVIDIDSGECRIEFRIGNEGAASILPPSVGRKWEPGLSLDDVEPAELPPHVADLLRSQKKPPKRAGSEAKAKDTIAEKLLAIVERKAQLWHTPEEIAYATIESNGHREHWQVRAKRFRQWLAKEFYQQEKSSAPSVAIVDVLNTVEGKALFDGSEHPIYLRIAGEEGVVWIDLANEDWQAIKVEASGWTIVDNPTVRFRRPSRILPLPIPKRGGSLAELKPFLRTEDRHWPLEVGWLVGALNPFGPCAIRKDIGQQGGGKTTRARVIGSLIDPNVAPTRSAPHNERDLMIAAYNAWLISFDNSSYISNDISDSLCRLATGGGFSTRTLYENNEETVFHGRRPISLNGIEDVGLRGDLIDRSIVIESQPLPDDERLSEKEFDARFEAARPRVFGALLDAVACALKNLPAVQQRTDIAWPRMADFAQWVVAAEPALGLEPGEFLKAYEENRRTALVLLLDTSPVVPAIRRMLSENESFSGTARQLLEKIKTGQDPQVKGWPKDPRVLAGMLNRLAPALREDGIRVVKGRRGNDKIWNISTVAKDSPRTHRAESTQVSSPSNSPLAAHLRAKGVK